MQLTSTPHDKMTARVQHASMPAPRALPLDDACSPPLLVPFPGWCEDEGDLFQKCRAVSHSRRINVKELGAVGSDVSLTCSAQRMEASLACADSRGPYTCGAFLGGGRKAGKEGRKMPKRAEQCGARWPLTQSFLGGTSCARILRVAVPGRPSGPGAESKRLPDRTPETRSVKAKAVLMAVVIREKKHKVASGGSCSGCTNPASTIACRASHPDPGPRANLAEGVCASSAERERTLRGGRTCRTCRRASISAPPSLSLAHFPPATKL